MKFIVLDTNVYGWALDGSRGVKKHSAINSLSLVQKFTEDKDGKKRQFEIFSCKDIKKETRKAKEPDLERLHDSLVSGLISFTPEIESLAEEYYKTCKERGIVGIQKSDCRIIASVTFAGIKFFVTENRKTIIKDDVLSVLEKVNKKGKLKTPSIITSNDALKILF